jgi:histidinol dehydrogenase
LKIVVLFLFFATKNSFLQLANSASLMAEAEGLTAHQLSIDIRKL